MNGRQRIVEAVAGQQPARRWELCQENRVSRRQGWYYVGGGYRLDVWFTGAGAVNEATLSAANGAHRYVSWRRVPGKLETVLGWVAEPAAAFAEAAPA